MRRHIIHRSALFLVQSLSLIVFISATAWSQVNETPGARFTYVFEPSAYDLGDHSGPCRTTSSSHDYIIDYNIESGNPGTNPSLTLPMFRNALVSGSYGVFWVHSHANSGVIGVESYENSAAGMTARDNAYQNYINSGYTATQISPGASTTGYYFILVRGQGIADWFVDADTLVYAKGCETSGFNNSWGARDVLGYNTTISGFAGCDTFFERMDGTRDRGAQDSRRPVDQADDGIAHLVHVGEGNTVISPVVIDYAPRYIAEEGDAGFVEFDCVMDTTIPANQVLTMTGAADLSDVHWASDHRIDFDIINVEPPSSLSFYVNDDKAISANNGARLDGNTNPTDTNGVGPNRDNFVWSCETSYVAMMDFEDGLDGNVISSTIPGLEFITTEGYDWIYADKTTGNYNIYPYGSQYYYIHGNVCAWLGPAQGTGKINFSGATATSVSMMTTNNYGLYLDAYDSSNNLIDSSYAAPNTQTLGMDQIKVAGTDIAYVLVHDTGNYWAIDDLVVNDLLRKALAELPQPFDSLLEELNEIAPGAVQSFLVTAEDIGDVIDFILDWMGSEFRLRIYRPDGSLYGEWQSDSPPIIGQIPYPENGDWIFEVTAIDVPSDNYPYALAVTERIHLYDAWITPPDIQCSTEAPAQGEDVTLSANVHCDPGSDEIPSARVRFYDGDPYGSGVQIGSDLLVGAIAPGSAKEVQTSWLVPDTQPHDLYVLVDPENEVEEYNEDNNISFTTISPLNIIVNVTFPAAGDALQDGVTLAAETSGDVEEVYFYIREPDGSTGVPIGQEYLPGTYDSTSGQWEHVFDTTQLPDGYYVILAKAVDISGNEVWSNAVSFSIRNWAVLACLPACEDSKAGRTMPVKFSLRIAEAVDPTQPFVYNEQLEIRVYDASRPGTILQTSYLGDSATDYRIDTVAQFYIINFKTAKKPAEYVVEIWRTSKNFMVGSFTFETVK